MKTLRRIAFPVVMILALVGFSVAEAAPQRPAEQAAVTSFHFEFAADSRGNYTVLPAFSHKMVTFRPVFAFFAGDLCSTFDTTCIKNRWMPAMDGNNHDGMLARTFASRGNHDNGSLSTWQGLWNSQGMATRLGATQFAVQTSDATYSFDYGNSHFAVIDNPSGGAKGWTSAQISWLDRDLTAAERRGKVHEFLISHGPMYTVTTEHAGDLPSSALKAVLNRHPRLIGFHGHEHVTAYTRVTPSYESGINAYRQFTLGRAGAPGYPISKRVTWSANQNAFGDIAVNGSNVTITIYSQSGSKLFARTFTESVPSTPRATSTLARPTATPASVASLTFVSVAAYDGQVLEDTRTSGTGGSVYSGDAFRLGVSELGAEYRGILSFATAPLPDRAGIISVTLRIKQAGAAGPNPFGFMGPIVGAIKSGAFGNNILFQPADFQNPATAGPVLTIANNSSGGWYSAALVPGAFPYISRTGTTQFRLRFLTVPDNRVSAAYLSFCAGDWVVPSDRPRLTIRYTVP